MTAKRDFEHLPIPLDGRLITAEDPANIGRNYQVLKNMRYTDTRLKAIKGMTKINTNPMNATYIKPRSAFHFRKAQPSETHLLVQAYNSAESASAVLRHSGPIPDPGGFNATPTWVDAAGSARGFFADAPQGQVIYTNGKESVIWGGNEMQIAGFIHYDNNDTAVSKDYTDQLRSTDTDADGVATLNLLGSGNAIDSDTMLLLHCDGTDASTTFTDSSPTTPHTVTANGNAQIDAAQKKFGSASGLFDGTGDYLSIPDNADFNLAAGTWTIDLWCRLAAMPAAGQVFVLYYQQTDASNYMQIDVDENGQVGLTIVAATVTVVSLRSTIGPGKRLTTTEFRHIAVQEDGNAYKIYHQGDKGDESSDADRAANYTGSVYIGANSGGTSSLNGWLDEFRVSDVARFGTGGFHPPTAAYTGSSSSATSFYLASTRPLEAFKLYVGTANATVNSMVVSYWNGTAWIAVSNLVDGTSVSGVSLAQTGVVTFNSTDNLAKIKEINGTFLYWYRVEIAAGVGITTTLTYATVRPAWQKLKDIWDGQDRPVVAFLANKDGTFKDFSTNVLENTYDSADSGTYAAFSPSDNALQIGEYLYMGFAERMMGLFVSIVEDKNNTTAATGLTLEYWNGIAWTSVSGLNDGTSRDNISFAKGGVISWDAPNKESEFKYTLLGLGNVQQLLESLPGNNDWQRAYNAERLGISIASPGFQRKLPPLYFYRISFTQSLSTVWAFYVAGIPAPNPPVGYRYSFQADNRVWLVGKDEEDRNSVRTLSVHAPDVANGDDTSEFFLGSDEDSTCGAGLFVRTSDTFQTLKVIFKANETWLITGFDNETWKQSPDPISRSIGCPAPGTLRTVNWRNGQILIWQGSQGLYVFDGGSIIEISRELRNLFEDGILSNTDLKNGYAFVDEFLQEYHWLCDGREFVYDLKRSQPAEGVNKWYEVDRGSGLTLKTGCSVQDTNGNHYAYGGIDTGFIERLENGTTFDGAAITATFQLGDMSLQNDVLTADIIRTVRLIGKSKTTTDQTILVQWFKNGETAVTDSFTMATAQAGSRVFRSLQSDAYGPATFHSLKFSITTNNETVGFEPLLLAIGFVAGTSDVDEE